MLNKGLENCLNLLWEEQETPNWPKSPLSAPLRAGSGRSGVGEKGGGAKHPAASWTWQNRETSISNRQRCWRRCPRYDLAKVKVSVLGGPALAPPGRHAPEQEQQKRSRTVHGSKILETTSVSVNRKTDAKVMTVLLSRRGRSIDSGGFSHLPLEGEKAGSMHVCQV